MEESIEVNILVKMKKKKKMKIQFAWNSLGSLFWDRIDGLVIA